MDPKLAVFTHADLPRFGLGRRPDRLQERLAEERSEIETCFIVLGRDPLGTHAAWEVDRQRFRLRCSLSPDGADVLIGTPLTQETFDRLKLGIGFNPIDQSNCCRLQTLQRLRRPPRPKLLPEGQIVPDQLYLFGVGPHPYHAELIEGQLSIAVDLVLGWEPTGGL